jgi:hypothetical protein
MHLVNFNYNKSYLFLKFYKPWLREKELSHLVRDTLRSTASAEDAENRACTFRKNSAQVADFQPRNSEDITGPKKPAKERERVVEE